MKPLSVLLLLPFLAVSVFAKDNIAYEYTQTGMNEAAGRNLKTTEAELKKLIENLIRTAEGKPEAIKKLRKAQAAWEAYRDAQIDALWLSPETRPYGSVHPMCLADVKRQITEARIRELKAMLNPEEGEACSSRWPE